MLSQGEAGAVFSCRGHSIHGEETMTETMTETRDAVASTVNSNEAQRLDYAALAPGALKALQGVEQYVRQSGLERSLLHLVKLRASYMNGCAYCVDMHTKEARAHGESEQRLYAIAVWRETPFFTPRERAALAWTEAVTAIGAEGVSSALHAVALEHFTELELVNLTMAVIAINSWNRLATTFRREVGGYEVVR
jgi:AhpD family alkylhydroperoxidase